MNLLRYKNRLIRQERLHFRQPYILRKHCVCSMVYRSKVRIVLDVLSAVKQGSEDGVGISTIMRKANVPYSRVIEVLGELLKAGLIDEVSGKRFRITPAGIKFVGEWEKFEEFAKSFGLSF